MTRHQRKGNFSKLNVSTDSFEKNSRKIKFRHSQYTQIYTTKNVYRTRSTPPARGRSPRSETRRGWASQQPPRPPSSPASTASIRGEIKIFFGGKYSIFILNSLLPVSRYIDSIDTAFADKGSHQKKIYSQNVRTHLSSDYQGSLQKNQN